MSSGTQQTFDLAKEIAGKMGHQMIGTEHWLWAIYSLSQEKESETSKLINQIGVSHEKVFETFKKLYPEFQVGDKEGEIQKINYES